MREWLPDTFGVERCKRGEMDSKTDSKIHSKVGVYLFTVKLMALLWSWYAPRSYR